MRALIFLGLASAVALFAVPAPASAGIVASGTLSTQLDADAIHFDHTIKLTNTLASTDTIGTFWFAWIPGQDYLRDKPLSVTTPAGWVSLLTHFPNVPTNGWAIQWKATSAASYMAVGDTLTFGFVNLETIDQLTGPSPYFDHPVETTSVVYNQAPFSAVSATITLAAVVPEPSTLTAAALGLLGGVYALARRRKTARTG